jgi:site-specific DNA-methyltransferase (adenine-specific)
MSDVQVIQGDNREILSYIPDNTFDTIITDPPYGLSFMGKKWDYDVPSIALWKECLRVLKPSGTALIFAGSRTQHRMAVNVEDAGFELKDCIMWLYGSGFPKATDISKQLDKRAGVEGEIIGERRFGTTSTGQGIGWNNNNVAATGRQDIKAPATPEAILWNGWKSHGLKPAYEPILVAMKPNEGGSYVANALKWGVAGLNIDGGRIGTDENLNGGAYSGGQRCEGDWKDKSGFKNDNLESFEQSTGRFPANIILDEEAGAMLDEQSGIKQGSGKSYDYTGQKEYQVEGFIPDNKPNSPSNRGDSGGASRFFYCAKSSKSERNAGCEELQNEKFTAGNYSQSPTCVDCNLTLNGTNDHSKCSGKVYYKEMSSKNTHNHHPTVKPLALMEYLCTLTKTPTGGVVLDPFAGSGTTGVACINTGRDCLLIEREPEYCQIIEKRLAHARIGK